MHFSKLIHRTPKRVVGAFVFAYSSTWVMVTLPPALKLAQMI
jgi:hypothetical protein